MASFQVAPEYAGWRLDKYLAALMQDRSRSEIQAGILAGNSQVNGVVVQKKGWVLAKGDVVVFQPAAAGNLAGKPETIPLDIRYEDEWLLVVNKPAGMVVHPAPGHGAGTLVNGLIGYGAELSDLGGGFRPGIVHRLDKDTSGLLLVAKNNACHLRLAEMLREQAIDRIYLALLRGRLKQSHGAISGPIGRHPRQRIKMAIVEGGKPSLTYFRLLRYFAGYSLVLVKLGTGRTHQIRVHFAGLGYPVVGDRVYGNKAELETGAHMLHARTLTFCHPFLNKKLSITAEPPSDFLTFLRRFNRPEEQ